MFKQIRDRIDDLIIAPIQMTLEVVAYLRDGIRNHEEDVY